MNKLTLLTITILASACTVGDGTNGPETFADGAFLISESFCERSYECGERVEQAIGACIDSNVYQLCALAYDCDADLTGPESRMFTQCAIDLDNRECGAPVSELCVDVLNLGSAE